MIVNLEKHKKNIDFSSTELSEFWYMRFFHYFRDEFNPNIVNDRSKIFEFNNQITNSSINLKNYFKFDNIFDEVKYSFQYFYNNQLKDKF